MSQSKFGHFLTGAMVGIGLGIIFAPKNGSQTRDELKSSFENLLEKIKNIDIEETKANLLKKVSDLKKELSNLEADEVKTLINEKAELIIEKCDMLIKESEDASLKMVAESAQEVKEKTLKVLNELGQEPKTSQKQRQNSKRKSISKKK